MSEITKEMLKEVLKDTDDRMGCAKYYRQLVYLEGRIKHLIDPKLDDNPHCPRCGTNYTTEIPGAYEGSFYCVMCGYNYMLDGGEVPEPAGPTPEQIAMCKARGWIP